MSSYMKWPVAMDAEQAERWGFLRSMTPRQELAGFVGMRGPCLLMNGRHGEAVHAYAVANELDGARPGHLRCVTETMDAWDKELKGRCFPAFPPLRLVLPNVRRYPAMPRRLEGDIHHLLWVRNLLDDPRLEARWWGAARRDPKALPPDFPGHVTVAYPPHAWDSVDVIFSKQPPPGFDPANKHFPQGA